MPRRHAHPYGRQVGGPAPRGLPSPGAACAGGAPTRPRPRARAVRPARGNPWGRSGRLHAPEAARTGPVNALRRYSSWSPPGRWLNGHNGHFSCQPGRDHLGTSPGGYGSGFNGPRAVFLSLPTISPAGPRSGMRWTWWPRAEHIKIKTGGRSTWTRSQIPEDRSSRQQTQRAPRGGHRDCRWSPWHLTGRSIWRGHLHSP